MFQDDPMKNRRNEVQEIRLIRNHPCSRSEMGGVQGFPYFHSFNHSLFIKKSSDQTAIDFSPNDEQTLSPAEHWPPFITLEVQSDSQPKPCPHS